MLPFHQFLPSALRNRGLSLRAASLKINRSAPYLATLCRDGSEPTLGALLDLARLMDLTVDDLIHGRDNINKPVSDPFSYLKTSAETFAAYAEKHARNALEFRADEPNLEQYVSWFMASDGDLTLLDGLADYVDLYMIPSGDAQRPILHKMGARSLASRTINNPSTERLTALLKLAPPAIARLVVVGHIRCFNQGTHSSVEQIDFPIDGGDRVSLRYYRSLFLGRKNKQKFIVNFSKVIV